MNEDKLPKQLWMEALMKTKLTHATKSVAWVISNRAYGQKTESNPSNDLIAEEAGVSRKNVWKHINELEEAGWVVITKKQNSIQRDYNNYKMTTPQITAPQITAPQEAVEEAQPQDAVEAPQTTETQPQITETQPQETGGISNKEVIEEVSEEVIKTPPEAGDISLDYLPLNNSVFLDAERSLASQGDEASISSKETHLTLGNADWVNPRQAERNYKQAQKKKDFARWSK